jgi:CheY-like chemotaxis protein
VLVVDDDEEIRETIDLVLAQYGLECCSACSGRAALELIRGSRPPVVALVDLRMPNMTGIELVREMRREPVLAATRIVVMSGDSEGGAAAAELAADGYLRKPFELESLVSTVQRLVSQPPGPALSP